MFKAHQIRMPYKDPLSISQYNLKKMSWILIGGNMVSPEIPGKKEAVKGTNEKIDNRLIFI